MSSKNTSLMPSLWYGNLNDRNGRCREGVFVKEEMSMRETITSMPWSCRAEKLVPVVSRIRDGRVPCSVDSWNY